MQWTNPLTFRDIGSISNLGGHDAPRALFSLEKGTFSKNKKGTSLFIAKSWGVRAPSAPWFLRLCFVAQNSPHYLCVRTKGRGFDSVFSTPGGGG